jgi:hypothetical protein
MPKTNTATPTLPFPVHPTSKGHIDAIRRALGPTASAVVRLSEVDVERGEGLIGPASKCVWTKDGRRITFTISGDGSLVGTVTREPDPLAPERPRKGRTRDRKHP